MKFKIIFILFYLFIYYIKLINSFDFIIKIDFTSKIEYINYECGGSLVIEIENGEYLQSNKTIYPPCKSFADAGNRSNRLFNSERDILYNNVSLVLLIQNPNGIDFNNYTISLKHGGVGYILHYCFFEIRFENFTNSIPTLHLDNVNSTGIFMGYPGYSNPKISCDQNILTRVKLSNLNLKSDGGYMFDFGNHNNNNNNPTKTYTIELSSIKTEGVLSLLFTPGTFNPNSQINLLIKDSIFDGMNITPTWSKDKSFIEFEGILTIENCTFKNFLVDGIIVSKHGDDFNGNEIKFINIKMDNNFSFFNLLNIKSTINNILIENSIFSNFLELNCDPTLPNCKNGHYLSNISFKNNQIKYNLKIPPYVIVIRVFKAITPIINFDNITIESNNQIENNKELFEFSKTNAFLNNVQIPNNFQFSISFSTDNSNLEIDNKSNSILNSKILCSGSHNNIVITKVPKNELNLIKNQINNIIENQKSCINCNISYNIIKNEENNNDDTIQPDKNNSGSSNIIEKVSSSSSSFNKILIIPIVLSVLLISIIIIGGFIFKNKIKEKIETIKIKKRDRNEIENENKGDVDHDTGAEMDLEIIN